MFTVRVVDLAHRDDPGGERLVQGFPDAQSAAAYAVARLRDSLEELRAPGASAADLIALWHLYGEDCLVVETKARGSDQLAAFAARPATAQERDWRSLTPRPRRFHASLMVANEARSSVSVSENSALPSACPTPNC